MVRIKPSTIFILALTSLQAGAALASAPSLKLNIQQYDASGSAVVGSWNQDMSPLLIADTATGNFSMLQGAANQTIGAWNWQTDTSGNYWAWHSDTTVSGATTASGSDPWASIVRINAAVGHGDPDLSYGYFAKNNTGAVQTYSFTIGETMVPPVSGGNTVYADIGASLSNPSGSLSINPAIGSHLQQFMLSNDGGVSFVNAGVDVGNAYTTSALGTTNYPGDSATASGPTGPWNYMQLVTSFTLTPNKDVASVSGFASITPALPVPEPSSYLMLMAGLGMISLISFKRSK